MWQNPTFVLFLRLVQELTLLWSLLCGCSIYSALQRRNTENLWQIFPARPQSQFPHSCVWVCIHSHHRSAYSAAGKYVVWSWEYTNRSHTHECGNWDWGLAIPCLGIHKWDFRCSVVTLSLMPSVLRLTMSRYGLYCRCSLYHSHSCKVHVLRYSLYYVHSSCAVYRRLIQCGHSMQVLTALL